LIDAMRRLGLILNVLVTMLLVAVVALWLRSHLVADVLLWQHWSADLRGTYRGTFRMVTSGRGVLGIDLTELTTAFPARSQTKSRFEWSRGDASQFRLPDDTFWNRIGFGYASQSQTTQGLNDSTVTVRAYWLPYWLLAVVASVVPLRWVTLLVIRARRQRQGLCALCGYDVRVSEGRCPECGSALPSTGRNPTSTTA
jgi:hypothetical protein